MLIDLRAAADYQHGHLPGAISFPLQIKPENWRRELEDFFQPRWDPWKQRLRRLASKYLKPGVTCRAYCQTGTWKSAAFRQLAKTVGLEVAILPSGYRGYLAEQEEYFQHPFSLMILGGETGTGKTALLHALAQAGEQTVDLEFLAGHKGSVFGALGQEHTVTCEQFRNDLMAALQGLDQERLIWVEDEAPALGRAGIPQSFWERMRASPGFRLIRPLNERVQRIIRDYGHFPATMLSEAILQLGPRLGPTTVGICLAALEEGKLEIVVERLFDYYDPAYTRQLEARRCLQDLACGNAGETELVGILKAALYGDV